MARGQSRLGSLIEAWVNIVIGYTVAVISHAIVLPIFGIYATTTQLMEIGVYMTFISIIRSYLVRRMFNSIHSRWNRS